MKIINRKDFLNLPIGVLFAKYDTGSLEIQEPMIKGETIGNDFFYTDIFDNIDCGNSNQYYEILDDAEKFNIEIQLNLENSGRDGFFEDNQLFIIYSKSDLITIINLLNNSLNIYNKLQQ